MGNLYLLKKHHVHGTGIKPPRACPCTMPYDDERSGCKKPETGKQTNENFSYRNQFIFPPAFACGQDLAPCRYDRLSEGRRACSLASSL
jgi:hypothetical protein